MVYIISTVIISLGFLLLLRMRVKKKSSVSTTLIPSYPIIGCLISFYKNRKNLLDWYTHLLSESSRKTIVVSRLGACPTIITADPVNVEHILTANFGNYPKGRPFREILGDFLGDGIFSVDGELWSAQRKLASHEFSTKTLREFVVGVLHAQVHTRLLPLLHHYSTLLPHNNGGSPNPKVLDLQEILGRFAFDTVCQVSLGTDPCSMDLSRPVPTLVTAFDVASKTSAMRGAAPISLLWKLKRALNLGSERHLAIAVKQMHQAVSNIIQTKRTQLAQQETGGCDLLTRFLVAGHDQDFVRDMVISFIMAGRDTTSAAMTWLFWLLSYHPDVEKNIVKEVDSILSEEGKVLDFEALKKMDYLKACLCESMRLYPPVAWDSKYAAADDVLPDGTPVRKGDRVTYFPYGMGRMENLWGKDRMEFKPERWFTEAGELKVVSPFKFPVFQAGARVCLGKEMAFIQMKYVVASVLQRFEIRPVSDKQPIFVPLLTAHMAGGFKVLIRPKGQLIHECRPALHVC